MKNQFKNIAMGFGLLITTVSLVACGNMDKKKESDARNDTIITKKVVTDEMPAVADVSFKDKNGKTVSLSSLKGKVVFINFWATWCLPCIHEMPSINEMKKSFNANDNIVFLMVDVDNKMEKSSKFMRENNYDLPVYVPVGDIPSDYLGGAIPTTVILDKSGNMIARMEGGRDYARPEITTALNELIESK